MIANVEFNNPKKGAIRTYAKYMMSPKDQAMPLNHSGHTAGNERLEAVYCNGLTPFDAQKGQRSINNSCKQFEAEIRAWNKTYKQGQKIKDTSNQCVLGTISFGENDKITVADAMAKAQEVVKNVMPGTRLALFTVHGDSNVLHVHFEASVVDMETGKAYAPQGEYRAMYNQWELECERMELAYPDQLEHVQQREAVAIQERKAGIETTRSVNYKQLSHKSHQKLFKRGMSIDEVPEADLRREFTLACKESNNDFDALLDNLEARGIRVMPNMGTTSTKVSGLAIAFENEPLSKGVALGSYGDKYKWKNLSKDFNYVEQLHRDRLAQLRLEANATSNTRTANSVPIGAPLPSPNPANPTVANASTAGLDPLAKSNSLDTRDSSQLDPSTTSGLVTSDEAAHGHNHTGTQAREPETVSIGRLGRVEGEPSIIDSTDGSPDRTNQHATTASQSLDGTAHSEAGPIDQASTGTDRSTTQDDDTTKGRTRVGVLENHDHNVSHNGGVMRVGNVSPDNPTGPQRKGAGEDSLRHPDPTGQGTKPALQAVIDLCGDPPITEDDAKGGKRITDEALMELAHNVPEPTNTWAFESESEAIERIAKAIKKAIEEDGPVMVPAPPTINGPHVETLDERVNRLATAHVQNLKQEDIWHA